jgi:hypothetical protein
VTLLESGSLAAPNLGDSDAGSGASSQATVRRGMIVQTREGHTAGYAAWHGS